MAAAGNTTLFFFLDAASASNKDWLFVGSHCNFSTRTQNVSCCFFAATGKTTSETPCCYRHAMIANPDPFLHEIFSETILTAVGKGERITGKVFFS